MGCLTYLAVGALKLAWLGIRYLLFGLIVAYQYVCKLIPLLGKPFVLLFNKLTASIKPRLTPTETLNKKFSFFNGFYPFLLFISAIVFSGIMCLLQLRNRDSLLNFIEDMMFNSSFYFLIGVITGEVTFTASDVVAIAFSSYILALCTNSHHRIEKDSSGDEIRVPPPLYLQIPYYLVYITANCLLAMLLRGVFHSVGQWGYQTIVSLWQNENRTVLLIVGKIIALLPLLYLAFYFLIIAVKEFTENLAFSIAGLLVLAAVGVVLSAFLPHHVFMTVFVCLVIVLTVATCIVRHLIMNSLDDYLEDWKDLILP